MMLKCLNHNFIAYLEVMSISDRLSVSANRGNAMLVNRNIDKISSVLH